MNDTTMQTLERITRLHEKASLKHTVEENQKAYDRGVENAKNCLAEGASISLQDEAGVFMSDLQIAETQGWNSQCFTQEHKALIEKRKSE